MILSDTQAAVWLTIDRSKLSTAAKQSFSEAASQGNGIAVASSTLWEIAMMITKRKIQPDCSMSEYLKRVQQRFTVLPLTAEVAERSVQFGNDFPKDPADRIIAATALVHGISLVTSDKAIRKSGEVHCIW